MSNQQGQCPRCHVANSYTNLECWACNCRLPWADAVSGNAPVNGDVSEPDNSPAPLDSDTDRNSRWWKASSEDNDENLTFVDWLGAILLGGIAIFGMVMGAIWAVQGKPKGLKMIGASIVGGLIWWAGYMVIGNPIDSKSGDIPALVSQDPENAGTSEAEQAPSEPSPAVEEVPGASQDNFSPQTLGLGSTVAAQLDDGVYLGTVMGMDKAAGRYDILTTDERRTVLGLSSIRHIRPELPINVGDRVLAVWESGAMYPGTVAQVSSSGYIVRWDDGGTPSHTPKGAALKLSSASPTVQQNTSIPATPVAPPPVAPQQRPETVDEMAKRVSNERRQAVYADLVRAKADAERRGMPYTDPDIYLHFGRFVTVSPKEDLSPTS